MFVKTIVVLSSFVICFMHVGCTNNSNQKIDDNDVLMFNTHNAKYDEAIDGKICKLIRDRGLDKLILCNSPKGYYFEYDKFKNTEIQVREFITIDLTRIVKEMNNHTVYFINENDTLKVKYKVFKDNLALWDGVVVK